MLKLATLGKIALGLTFPVYTMIYFTQNRIARRFAEQTYFKESLKLLEGYKPLIDKLGEPITVSNIDVSDEFNYQDDKIARAKVPIQGTKLSAYLIVFASKNMTNNQWDIDSLEIMFNSSKFKFYDGSLVKK